MEFHEAGKTYRRRIARTGNRWGKSHAGANESLAYAYGYRFWEVEGLSLIDGDLPPRESIHRRHWILRADGLPVRVPNTGMIVTGLAMGKGIGQVAWPKLQYSVPQGLLRDKLIRTRLGSGGTPIFMLFPNGSEIRFGSKEQDRAEFEGFDIDWCWVDEPVPRWVFNGLWRGLTDHYGPIWFTMTPLSRTASWLKDYEMREEVFVIQRDHRENPYITKEQFDEMENEGQWSPREAAARKRGEYEFGGGQVLHTLDPGVHFVEPFAIPSHWIVGQTVDPHHRKAAFVLWWAVDPSYAPNYIYHFFREWPDKDYFKMEGGALSPTEYAVLFRTIEAARPADIRLCDPRFGKAEYVPAGMRDRATVWVREMANAGLVYEARIPNTHTLKYGHMKMVEMLRWERNFPVGPTNTPHIFIHKTCTNTMKAAINYAFLDQDDDPTKEVNEEKVSEEFKDPVDCMRYTVLFPMPSIDTDGSDGQFSEDDLARYNQETW